MQQLNMKWLAHLTEMYRWAKGFPQASSAAQLGKAAANNIKIEKERISNRARCAAGDK